MMAGLENTYLVVLFDIRVVVIDMEKKVRHTNSYQNPQQDLEERVENHTP